MLLRIIYHLFPSAVVGRDFEIDTTQGAHATDVNCITFWDVDALGPMPAQAAIDAAANAVEDAAIMDDIRAERNRRLAATDYMAMPDYPAQPAGLAAYRQALRDFPASVNPATLSWPVNVATLQWPVLN